MLSHYAYPLLSTKKPGRQWFTFTITGSETQEISVNERFRKNVVGTSDFRSLRDLSSHKRKRRSSSPPTNNV